MNDSNVARLEKATGLPWRKVSVTYLEFASQGSPFKEYCAATTSDPDDLNPSYYIPEDHQLTYSPDLFVQTLIGVNEIDVDKSVVFEISLDNLPAICFVQNLPKATVVGILQLTGKIRLQNANKAGDLSISNTNFEAVMAREKVAEIVSDLDIEVNNFYQVKVSSEIMSKFTVTRIEATPPASFTISVDPEMNQLNAITSDDWTISGNAGYELKGDIYPNSTPDSEFRPHPKYSFNINLTAAQKAHILIDGIILVMILKAILK